MQNTSSARSTVGGLLRHITAESGHALTELACHDATEFQKWWARLCAWPPNVFALTATVLRESGLYRVALEHQERDGADASIESRAREWIAAISNVELLDACCSGKASVPPWLADYGNTFFKALPHGLDANDEKGDPHIRGMLVRLHAIADEVGLGFGLPPDGFSARWPRGKPDPRRQRRLLPEQQARQGLARLCDIGTLSCFDAMKVRVLPKKHTPQVGVTLRSISLYLAAVRGEVRVTWRRPAPERKPAARKERDEHDVDLMLNLLLVPWPYEIHASTFECLPELPGSSHAREFMVNSLARTVSGGLTPEKCATGLLAEAKRRGLRIDGVIFPELALDQKSFQSVQKAMPRGTFLLAGVSVPGKAKAVPPSNEAWLNLADVKRAGEVLKQEKHHKWCVDAAQIRQYHLGAALRADPSVRYWERMHVGPRSICFAHIRPRLTLCHLICEDLARVEPVAEVVRAVGPNLVVALLMDGPQLEKRWPGRYASIFADDPGSSVLTVSCYGMVRRSKGRDDAESSVVALWKDSLAGTRELALGAGNHGLVLSLSTNSVEEFTFDGRTDGGIAGVLTFAGVEPLRLSMA